jgi:hypothetical protein
VQQGGLAQHWRVAAYAPQHPQPVDLVPGSHCHEQGLQAWRQLGHRLGPVGIGEAGPGGGHNLA